MFHQTMSNSTSLSEEASVSSGVRIQDFSSMNPMFSPIYPQDQKIKKKRNLPGNPDPDAEVIALSPKTLMATNRFVCEICNKGFQRDQNLQLHRRGHNLPWKLRQRNSKEMRKRVYVCPEPTCIHHHPSRALGDLTGIKKHFCRKHGEKKWKCEKCSKRYAVHSDWKAHSKTCGTREYRCDCGTLFSRKDSFVTHRAFCEALAEESARLSSAAASTLTDPSPPLQLPAAAHSSLLFPNHTPPPPLPASATTALPLSLLCLPTPPTPNPIPTIHPNHIRTHNQIPSFFHATCQKQEDPFVTPSPSYHHAHLTHPTSSRMVSAAVTDCMDAVANVEGSHMEAVGGMISPGYRVFGPGNLATWQKRDQMTRDFLGLAAEEAVNVRDLLSFNTVDFTYDRDHTLTWGDC